jgi:hypothetical protein
MTYEAMGPLPGLSTYTFTTGPTWCQVIYAQGFVIAPGAASCIVKFSHDAQGSSFQAFAAVAVASDNDTNIIIGQGLDSNGFALTGFNYAVAGIPAMILPPGTNITFALTTAGSFSPVPTLCLLHL